MRPIEEVEVIHVEHAYGRVLAEDAISRIDIPPCDRSAVDGFALRAEDVVGASNTSPALLKFVGAVDPGEKPSISLKPGEAVEVQTGSEIPPGANAVVMKEYTVVENATVKVYKPVAAGENVCKKGEEIRKGAIIHRKETLLDHRRIASLAHAGIRSVVVYREPNVLIVPLGEELLEPGSPYVEGKIYDCNSYALFALVESYGGKPTLHPIVAPEKNRIVEVVQQNLRHYDTILFTGSTAVGKSDILPETLQEMGAKVLFHGLRTKPAKPTGAFELEGKIVFALPGFPVSALIACEYLVCPVLAWLSHKQFELKGTYVEGLLTRTVSSAYGRRDFVRAVVRKQNGTYLVDPIVHEGASRIVTFSKVNGILEVPEELESIPKNSKVVVRVLGAFDDEASSDES